MSFCHCVATVGITGLVEMFQKHQDSVQHTEMNLESGADHQEFMSGYSWWSKIGQHNLVLTVLIISLMSVFPDFKRLAFRKMRWKTRIQFFLNNHISTLSVNFPEKACSIPTLDTLARSPPLGQVDSFSRSRSKTDLGPSRGCSAVKTRHLSFESFRTFGEFQTNQKTDGSSSWKVFKFWNFMGKGEVWTWTCLTCKVFFVKFQWNHSESCFHVFVFVMFDLCKSWRLQHSVNMHKLRSLFSTTSLRAASCKRTLESPSLEGNMEALWLVDVAWLLYNFPKQTSWHNRNNEYGMLLIWHKLDFYWYESYSFYLSTPLLQLTM